MSRDREIYGHGFYGDYSGSIWGRSIFGWFETSNPNRRIAGKGYTHDDQMQRYGSDSDILADPYVCDDEDTGSNKLNVCAGGTQLEYPGYKSRPVRKRARLQFR